MGRRDIRSRGCHWIFRKRRWGGWRLIPRSAPPSSGRSTPIASFLRVATASAETERRCGWTRGGPGPSSERLSPTSSSCESRNHLPVEQGELLEGHPPAAYREGGNPLRHRRLRCGGIRPTALPEEEGQAGGQRHQ